MNLSEYQKKALSTAAPIAHTYEYLAHGLIGEVGEFAGRIAKGVWKGDRGHAAFYSDLALEYGDIAWMAAILMNKQGIHGRDAWGQPFARSYSRDVHTPEAMVPLSEIMAEAAYLYRIYAMNTTSYLLDSRRLWDLLETHCEQLTRHSWDDVLQMNVDKLASRASRGVLIGNGDHR